jgi:predicted glycogen debranching enzyme
MKPITFTAEQLHNFDFARSLEWLETNGLGGYASSTVSGAHSRRYHGLLVASLKPPVERRVVLSKLDETIITGEKRYDLGTNQYPGAIHPKGHTLLQKFERGLFPQFVYQVGGVKVQKTIAAIHGENTTVILYEVLEADGEFKMELLPLSSFRDFHWLSKGNEGILHDATFQSGIFRTKNYHDSSDLFISVPGSEFSFKRNWYYNFEYAVEQYRGLEFREDLFTHGNFTVPLKEGSRLGVIVSTENPDRKNAFDLFEKEKRRRLTITTPFAHHEKMEMLALAADQFIVKRGQDLKTIVAGYHWFSDWGRDTMIALPGLCLATRRFEDAKKILKAFAESVSEGMLPNRFPDQGENPEYNTVDASLWFFSSIYQYYRHTNDKEFVSTLIPVLENIIAWHFKGTRYNIHVDQDGLLSAGQDGVQLTWMDAKVGDWVVTPRKGKAVEINALWYNAICIISELKKEIEMIETVRYRQLAESIKISFNSQFWNQRGDYLFDVVDGDDGDDDLRPNQLYAISLPFAILNKDKWHMVLDVVREKLLTPKGLRSLTPDHKDYKPHYGGDPWHRDGAYHQGTVWSFLLGAYIDSLVKAKGNKGKTEARQILNEFFNHLDEACVGSVSEIFDGEEPFSPRGCMAQAWGIGEIIRVAVEHDLLRETISIRKPEKRKSEVVNTIP